MPGFTSAEVQAAVDKFLLGSVSVPITSLGSRDVMQARDDIYALLTTTLLLRPDSYFYTIFLAKNRLEALRRQQADALSFILDPANVAALNRRGTPVTSTTDLTNARASLLNMNAGLNQTGGVQTRNLGPEVSRFRSSIESFVTDQLRPNVVAGSTVTETAGELRAKIETLWKEVVARHDQILTLCTAISDAISNLNGAKLPKSAVQAVVSRMQSRLDALTTELAADKTLETHRESMLELLTMRTLLTRVSFFRTPAEVLAPLTGDASQLSPIGGVAAGSITGTISGPFNVPPLSTLDFETGTPVTPSSIVMPRYSNAEVQSPDLVYPITFPLNAELRLRVDGTLYPAQSYSLAVYATDVAFLASINAYIAANLIPATAYISGAKIFIRSNTPNDISSVSVLDTTANQLLFLSIAGFTRNAICLPITAAEIILAGAPWPKVRLSDAHTEYGNFSGRTAAANVLDLSKSSGLVDVPGGDTLVFTTNLESVGVKKGDSIILLTGPEIRTITSVAGGVVTVDSPLPVIGIGIAYRIGKDFTTLPVGARVLVGSNAVPLNSGPYRAVAGDVAQVTVDRPFFVLADPVTAVLQTSFLVATATGATPTDGITANPASAGATAVGYVITAVQVRAGITMFEALGTVDFLARGVGVGDQLTLQTAPTPSVTTIESVQLTDLTTAAVPFFAGPVEYVIRSARFLAWLDLVATVSYFELNVDFAAADFAITRILNGAAATALLSGGGPVGLYSTQIALLGSIQDYVVPFERTIDNILRMLVEQGMDRAADLFTTLQVGEFFSMHPDGVSYSSNLIRTAADVTRQVAPVSRNARSIMVSPEVVLRYRRRTGG